MELTVPPLALILHTSCTFGEQQQHNPNPSNGTLSQGFEAHRALKLVGGKRKARNLVGWVDGLGERRVLRLEIPRCEQGNWTAEGGGEVFMGEISGTHLLSCLGVWLRMHVGYGNRTDMTRYILSALNYKRLGSKNL